MTETNAEKIARLKAEVDAKAKALDDKAQRAQDAIDDLEIAIEQKEQAPHADD